MTDMIRKPCSKCGQSVWHNPLKKEKDAAQEYRCTRCGHPPGSHIIGSGGLLQAVNPTPVPGNLALKAKYRPQGLFLYRTGIETKFDIPFPGTAVYRAGRFAARSMNKGSGLAVKSIRPRRRAYGPF